MCYMHGMILLSRLPYFSSFLSRLLNFPLLHCLLFYSKPFQLRLFTYSDRFQSGRHIQPHAVDLMGGENAPVGCVLRWCGWSVSAPDLAGNCFTEKTDLSLPATRRRVGIEVNHPKTAALVWAPCCKTWSRIREKQIMGHPNAPKPLRSDKALWGLKELQEPSMKRDREHV